MALKDAESIREMLGLKTKARVYEAARLGLIPCVRIGRQVRFDEDILREWIRKGGTIDASQSSPQTAAFN